MKRWDRNLEARDYAVPEKLRACVDDALSVATNETPFSILARLEVHEETPPAERRQARRAAVLARQLLLFGEFVAVGVEELDVLKIRALIMLRSCAPELLKERFHLTPERAILLEKRLLKGLHWTLLQMEWVPLGFTLCSPLVDRHRAAVDDDEDECARELGLDVRGLRLLRFNEFCVKIADTCATIDDFAKTLSALMRRVKTEFIAGLGESQAAQARKFGETRATVSAREKRKVEAPVKAQGQRGFKLLGGVKSEGHRAACKLAQKGNTSRRTGEERKAALTKKFQAPTANAS